jgi:hypothetical protein
VQLRPIKIHELDYFFPLGSGIRLQIGDFLLVQFRVMDAPLLLAFCDSLVESVQRVPRFCVAFVRDVGMLGVLFL